MVGCALHSGEAEPSRSERVATRTQQVGDHSGMVILHPLGSWGHASPIGGTSAWLHPERPLKEGGGDDVQLDR